MLSEWCSATLCHDGVTSVNTSEPSNPPKKLTMEGVSYKTGTLGMFQTLSWPFMFWVYDYGSWILTRPMSSTFWFSCSSLHSVSDVLGRSTRSVNIRISTWLSGVLSKMLAAKHHPLFYSFAASSKTVVNVEFHVCFRMDGASVEISWCLGDPGRRWSCSPSLTIKQLQQQLC